MDDNEVFKVSSRALERFKERWEILEGKPLEEGDVLPKLQELMIKSKPEVENFALLKRKGRYGGEHRYMVSGPWRLVWKGNCLTTVELQHLGFFSKPKLYLGEVRSRFLLKVIEQKDSTLIEKFVFKNPGGPVVLNLPGKPEVNAVIRLMRLCGADVEYKRIGQESQKQAIITVLLPEELRKFWISQLKEREVELYFSNQKNSYSVFGITYEDCREIINFFADQEWLDRIKSVKAQIESERQKRDEKKRQCRESQEEQRRLNLERKAKAAERRKIEKEKDGERQRNKRQGFIRLLSETLNLSADCDFVLRELMIRFPNQIQIDEHKIGKSWFLNYWFASGNISASIVIRDAPTREFGRKEGAEQMINKLRSIIKSAS